MNTADNVLKWHVVEAHIQEGPLRGSLLSSLLFPFFFFLLWADHMPNLRLLVKEKCNRRCRLCCNKLYDLKDLPVCLDFSPYPVICVTGGEPLLDMQHLAEVIKKIRLQAPDSKIIVYTAWRGYPLRILTALALADGLTLTLHERNDVPSFGRLVEAIRADRWIAEGKSLRVNIFKGVTLPASITTKGWQVQPDMVWETEPCLPATEVFMRTPHV